LKIKVRLYYGVLLREFPADGIGFWCVVDLVSQPHHPAEPRASKFNAPADSQAMSPTKNMNLVKWETQQQEEYNIAGEGGAWLISAIIRGTTH